MLSAECERLEALAARGEAEFNCDVYVVQTNCLRRLFESLGLQRVARDVTNSPAAIIGRIQARHIDKANAQEAEEKE